MIRIRFHGRCDQGAKTASRIVGTAAFHEGFTAQGSPIYRAERRGTPIAAFARLTQGPILERRFIIQPDLVVVADETLFTDPAAHVQEGVTEETAIFINTPQYEQRLCNKGKSGRRCRPCARTAYRPSRLRVVRPWPAAVIAEALRGRRSVAVLDQNLAPGIGGILFHEVAASLYHEPSRPRALCSYIGGLGGKNISEGEFEAIFEQIGEAGERGRGLGPILLYTEKDHQKMGQWLAIAGNER